MKIQRAGETAVPARRKKRPDGTSLKVAALAAAILLGASGASFLAANMLAVPPDQVNATGALPVYSAVGQRADELEFLIWSQFKEARDKGEPVTSTPLLGSADYAEVFGGISGLSALTGIHFTAVPGGLPVQVFTRKDLDGQSLLYFSLDNIPAQGVVMGGPVPDNTSGSTELLLQFCAALRPEYSDFYTSVYLQFLPAEGYDSLAEGWEAAATQKVLYDLLYLFNLNTVERGSLDTQLYSRLSQLSKSPIATQAYPILQEIAYAQREHIVADGTIEQQGKESFFFPNTPLPQGIWGNAPAEQLLQDFTGSLEIQVVTLDTCLLVVFNLDGMVLGIYYDPVLQTYSGVGFQ